ncbi:linoleate 13S-lipoxygenase 2-1, chloroplastic [Ricinus communis]|uniref:Lipoxygenase n=1 Tax=Ricinus communis TaxID=3988 RepID=B9RHK9_RICCO|nr:linoleate 13S-lipoxygenase 2-1, chloroplastic [Ricinus communis]EEF49219.1 lipoxygenase, putative [Ricinus communis]|eukprot:XP_002513228.1 linoleate 13S-lipoxygenase 2-1, chloroplastic [Ricinus communis]
MLSSQIQKLSAAKPYSLLPPKPCIHGGKASSVAPFRQQKCNPKKHQNRSLSVRASIIDKAISAVTHKLVITATVTVKVTVGGIISSIGITQPLDELTDIIGKSLLLELVSAELDPKSGLEKDPVKSYAHIHLGTHKPGEVKLEAKFTVPADFGEVGAVLVENEHHKEIFIESIVLEGFPIGPLTVSCNSWAHSKHDNPKKRIFFTNKSYLPSDTPDGLKRLREEELENLRGNGQGERKSFERIYDYDTYNDLGDPDSDPDLKRPVLGGSEHPYPRRCRTGRPRTKTDPLSESRTSDIYVPRDEAFSELKSATFSINTVKSLLHALVPSIETAIVDKTLGFPYFTAIDTLFNEGIELPKDTEKPWYLQTLLPRTVKTVKETGDEILRFETPEMFDRDKFAWFRDEEFSRQTLAGLNPFGIQLVTEWPLKSALDPEVYGPPESAITKEIIEQEIRGFMTVDEALKQNRLFILDYHDLLLPYVAKVRELEDTTLYGSRTLFFLVNDSTLRPVAIELTRPKIGDKPQWKQVFTPSFDATSCWLWRLAKAHALAHDSGIHQLVSHWLRTHACVEPYIIAANRQLSEMHPIYRLLHPHFRYTMEINALARGKLINGGGIIESTFNPGKYSLELSSVAYDKLWRFDTEALPGDLIKRGMAVEDPTAKHGLKLTIEDYPFANDGLELWDAIKQWVTDYVNHYYPEASQVKSDNELQAFWEEVRTKGHGDKKDEPWWPVLNTQVDLIQVLTTIIWVTSGHHAAVNFGQYVYAGYFPNRPTMARTNMPTEEPSEQEMELFLKKPEYTLLKCFPSQIQATKVMAVLDVLSGHSPEEEYIGDTLEPSWEADPVIKTAYERFSARLKELEANIDEKNNDLKYTNRAGAGVVPYELLKPFSEAGVTGKGVPNSISI